jgi:hypothetical protein
VLHHRHNWIWQDVIALVAVGLVATFAFARIFTTFVPWDDEGYFLQAYRDFLSGHAPYDRVFAIYGPFTFLSAALLARFDVVNVTHDNFSWVWLTVWILIASLMAGIVWRWTRRFSSTLVAFLLVGFRLKGLAKGVGHPQLWIILAVAVLLWLGLDWVYLPRVRRHAFWTGLVIGVILMCKINIGIFVSVATALALSLQIRGRPRTFVCGVLITMAAGLGFVLLFTSSVGSEKYFALAYLGSLAATVCIAIGRPVEQQPSLTSLKWLAAGLGICLCVGVGITLACGTTLRALFGALITTPVLLVRSYHFPFRDATRKGSILLSAIGLSAAVAMLRWRWLADVRPAWLGLLKVTAGAGLLCSFAYAQRQALTGSLLFLWLLIVDAQPMSDLVYCNRLLLALLCPLFSLQLFPMAGEQVDWAALMPVTAAAVLLADGTNLIDRESLRSHLPRLIRVVPAATGSLLAICLFLFVGGRALLGYSQWHDAQPVNLPGTHWLRLPPMEAARLTATVSELSRNCQTVLTIPGLYSFSLWSGVPPVEERRFNSWPFLWPDEVQKKELPKLRQNRGCVLVSRDMYRFFWGFAVSPGKSELLPEVQRTMRPIFSLQDLTLYRASQRPETSPNSAISMPPPEANRR